MLVYEHKGALAANNSWDSFLTIVFEADSTDDERSRKLFSNSPDELQGNYDVTNKDVFRGCLINIWQAKLIPLVRCISENASHFAYSGM